MRSKREMDIRKRVENIKERKKMGKKKTREGNHVLPNN